MPIYEFECTLCSRRMDVYNPISKSEEPPEEAGSETCRQHEWKKIHTSPPKKAYGPGWRGMKGYW